MFDIKIDESKVQASISARSSHLLNSTSVTEMVASSSRNMVPHVWFPKRHKRVGAWESK
jgi:hypothetical protein